jgi:hypothetical protein
MKLLLSLMIQRDLMIDLVIYLLMHLHHLLYYLLHSLMMLHHWLLMIMLLIQLRLIFHLQLLMPIISYDILMMTWTYPYSMAACWMLVIITYRYFGLNGFNSSNNGG